MNVMRKALFVVSAFVAGAFFATAASATPFVMHLYQQGSDVVASGSGEFNLTGLSTYEPYLIPPFVNAAIAFLCVGDIGAKVSTYNNVTGPRSFGNGLLYEATAGSGDFVMIYGGDYFVGFPLGYSSGQVLAGTATWSNTTLAALGVTLGTYQWTWGAAPDQSYTLIIGPLATGVPEPSAWALFGGGLLLLGVFVSLRRREHRAV